MNHAGTPQRTPSARPTPREQADPHLPLCREYVDAYLADYARRNRPNSLVTETQRLRRFREDFGGRRLDIGRAELKQWVHGEGPWADRGPIPRWEVIALITLYNRAIDVEDLPIARNPARRLRPPPCPQPPPTPAEFGSLVEACSTLGEYGAKMRSALLFAAHTLIRPGELYALQWSAIDFTRMRIHARSRIGEPGPRARLMALTPPARDAIRTLPRNRGWVFTSKTGMPLTPPTFAAYWRAVCAAADLRFSFHHATKHYGVHYMWAELGLSPRAIAAQGGWKLETANRLLSLQGYGESGNLRAVDAAFPVAPGPSR